SVTCSAEETRAIALAGMSLSYALAGILKRVGVLGPEAMEDALGAALSGVENAFSAADPSAALARQLLDLMGERLAPIKPEAASQASTERPGTAREALRPVSGH